MTDTFNCETASQPRNWLRQALTNPLWFNDDPPRWRNMPSTAEAIAERQKRARFCNNNGLSRLGSLLAGCSCTARCLSGSCPECGRAFQRLVVSQTHSVLVPSEQFVVASIVPRRFYELGRLRELQLPEFRVFLEKVLAEGGVGLALGGIDFSFNEHKFDAFQARWSPHFWVLIHRRNRPVWERSLRIAYRSAKAVPRPVKVKDWDGKMRAVGYAFKTNFSRRNSSETQRNYRNGKRTCKNTTYDRLRVEERRELFAYLHGIGLEARLVLLGIRISDTGKFRLDP